MGYGFLFLSVVLVKFGATFQCLTWTFKNKKIIKELRRNYLQYTFSINAAYEKTNGLPILKMHEVLIYALVLIVIGQSTSSLPYKGTFI